MAISSFVKILQLFLAWYIYTSTLWQWQIWRISVSSQHAQQHLGLLAEAVDWMPREKKRVARKYDKWHNSPTAEQMADKRVVCTKVYTGWPENHFPLPTSGAVYPKKQEKNQVMIVYMLRFIKTSFAAGNFLPGTCERDGLRRMMSSKE